MSNGEYSEMIELPVSTCEMVVVPTKKRLFKGRLIKKVNERSRDDLSTQVETTLSGAEKQADVGISVAKE
ncbi:MAG: hypothetical protein ILP02_02115, partial [Clostridia bacterium]|nr:hypothetical protein [Clostridia bacterium]